MPGRRQRNGAVSGPNVEGPVVTIARGSAVVLIVLGLVAGILVPLFFGSIKVIVGDYPPGAIMLLFAGFVASLVLGWRWKRYRDQLVVLGISMLAILGVIWAIFEDGYGPKAFMLSLVVTAGFMAVLGIYNVFLKKRQHRVTG